MKTGPINYGVTVAVIAISLSARTTLGPNRKVLSYANAFVLSSSYYRSMTLKKHGLAQIQPHLEPYTLINLICMQSVLKRYDYSFTSNSAKC